MLSHPNISSTGVVTLAKLSQSILFVQLVGKSAVELSVVLVWAA
jgi:hypothetical protein